MFQAPCPIPGINPGDRDKKGDASWLQTKGIFGFHESLSNNFCSHCFALDYTTWPNQDGGSEQTSTVELSHAFSKICDL